LACDIFCCWIDTILKSAKFPISINDKLNGLLFFLAEDVLSRWISKLVDSGKLDLIKGTRHMNFPSHTLYADDIMIFAEVKTLILIPF
jgi:hypothetical protein